MQNAKTPEQLVLESFFQKLADDPTFPKNSLKQLERARENGKLADVKQVMEACRLAGEEDAADIPS